MKIRISQNFESAVAKKTQMYNGKEPKKSFTFKILTGPNAQNYARVRSVRNLGELDYQNSKGIVTGSKMFLTHQGE